MMNLQAHWTRLTFTQGCWALARLLPYLPDPSAQQSGTVLRRVLHSVRCAAYPGKNPLRDAVSTTDTSHSNMERGIHFSLA